MLRRHLIGSISLWRRRLDSHISSLGPHFGMSSSVGLEPKTSGAKYHAAPHSIHPQAIPRNMCDTSRHENHGHEYSRAIEDLNSLQSNNQVLALAKYKNPEAILPLFKRQLTLAGIQLSDLNKLNVIHVSGTKGKGSTCAFLERILTKSDKIRLKVGSYNSPHLVSVTERIRIDGKPIDKHLFSKHFRHVYDTLKNETQRENISMPSYFSFLTILAFHIFLEEQVDCAIIEVGMGGEYDPTNIVEKPLACAITTLDLDHTNILGKTIEQIAWTKAGIIKANVPLFTINHEQEAASKMIASRAHEKCSPVYICKPLDRQYHGIKLGIRGNAQYLNASIACQLAAYYLAKHIQDKCKFDNSLLERVPSGNSIDAHSIELETNLQNLPEFFHTSLESCRLPGRCQIIECPGVIYFLDGAHTRKSMENCLEWFLSTSRDIDESARRFLMINVIGERDKNEVLRPLIKVERFNRIMFCTNRIKSIDGESSKSETFVRVQDHNYEKGLDNAKYNARVWHNLVAQHAENNPGSELAIKTSVHGSIMDCFRVIDEAKVPLMPQDEEFIPRPLHVLATGSLHFVGAILEAIGTCYPKDVVYK